MKLTYLPIAPGRGLDVDKFKSIKPGAHLTLIHYDRFFTNTNVIVEKLIHAAPDVVSVAVRWEGAARILICRPPGNNMEAAIKVIIYISVLLITC